VGKVSAQHAPEETTHNGWKNRATWNVAMWLGSDEKLYRMVTQIKQWNEVGIYHGDEVTYRDFATNYLVYTSAGTPDGIAWLDETLDYEALDELLEELG
jgi:hypothetical protein